MKVWGYSMQMRIQYIVGVNEPAKVVFLHLKIEQYDVVQLQTELLLVHEPLVVGQLLRLPKLKLAPQSPGKVINLRVREWKLECVHWEGVKLSVKTWVISAGNG